jgi:hypothetical protein
MHSICVCAAVPGVRRACALDFTFLIWLTTTSLAGRIDFRPIIAPLAHRLRSVKPLQNCSLNDGRGERTIVQANQFNF